MNSIQYTHKNKQLSLVRVSFPEIKHPREVLVKVAYSGVCGTDLHIIEGKFPCSPHPLTLGHEFSATVVDFGTEVTTLSKGDFVVVDPNSSCHKCHFCHNAYPHFCPTGGFYANLGVKNHGGWAEFCLCSIEQIHKLPDGISLKMAALTEPLSCLSHGWDLISPVPIGSEILVMGAGIIGTLWVCLLHLQGHRKVTLVEINKQRIKLLKGLMTDFNFKMVDPNQLKKDAKYDLVIDCTGCGPAIEKGIDVLNSGGKICIFGVASPDTKIKVSPFDIYMKELVISSVKVNPFSFPKAVGLLQALADRYLDFDKLGIKMFKLQEFSEALTLLTNGKITKAVFKM